MRGPTSAGLERNHEPLLPCSSAPPGCKMAAPESRGARPDWDMAAAEGAALDAENEREEVEVSRRCPSHSTWGLPPWPRGPSRRSVAASNGHKGAGRVVCAYYLGRHMRSNAVRGQ